MHALAALLEVLQVIRRAGPDRRRPTSQCEAVGHRLGVTEYHLVHASLEALDDIVPVCITRSTIQYGVLDAALLCLFHQSIPLVLPEKDHEAVLALLNEVDDHLVAGGVDQVVPAYAVINRTTCHLEKFRGDCRCVDGEDGGVLTAQ